MAFQSHSLQNRQLFKICSDDNILKKIIEAIIVSVLLSQCSVQCSTAQNEASIPRTGT